MNQNKIMIIEQIIIPTIYTFSISITNKIVLSILLLFLCNMFIKPKNIDVFNKDINKKITFSRKITKIDRSGIKTERIKYKSK